MMGRLLAFIAWTSVFCLGWLMATEIIPMWPAGAIFIVFSLVGSVSSVVIWGDVQKQKETVENNDEPR